MSLQEKVLKLKLDAAMAARHVAFWEKQIVTYGEAKATAVYTSLGLNHLEKKSVQWDGLTLSRQPTEIEKLCIKSISQAQDAGKESVGSILLNARSDLIASALSAIKKLTPAHYHEVILTMPEKFHDDLKDEASNIFQKGRRLVAAELARQTGKAAYPVTDRTPSETELKFRKLRVFIKQEDEDDELDNLVDLTAARIANDIQSRMTAAATRFRLLGLTEPDLWEAVRNEVGTGSTGYIDRAATGVTNRVLSMGRSREAEVRSDEWGSVEYSAVLDQNVCSPCSADDGETAKTEDDLTPTPNPECEGGDWCRCFHVFINQ